MDQATIEAAAQRLIEAERSLTPLRHFTLDYPGITLDDSYAIQHAWLARRLAEGRVVKGHKIGLTSRAMQSALGISEPDYGVLLDDMVLSSGADIDAGRYMTPKIEVELAFVLGRELRGPGCTVFDVLRATEYVVPALELIDTRIQRIDPATGVNKRIEDNVADNAGNAALVLGGRPFRPLDVDLRWVSALLYRNGRIEESGVAAAVMDHPANGVAWLANKLAPHGIALQPGEVILGGSFTRPVDARRGDGFHVDYGPYGSIACRFV